MKRIADEELILHYYGESSSSREIEDQLASSSELRKRYAALCLVLDAVAEPSVPDLPESYASRVWHRVAPEIRKQESSGWDWNWLRPRRQWALAAVMVVLLGAAFLVGRLAPDPDSLQLAGLSGEGRERILLMTVAGHLERSEMLLLELVNTQDDGDVDLSLERQLASELGQESRLYRQAARQAGKTDVAAFLEQLETVLLELSHGPQTISSSGLGELRVRLDEGDVLFKVRVLGTRLRREVEAGVKPAGDEPEPRDI